MKQRVMDKLEDMNNLALEWYDYDRIDMETMKYIEDLLVLEWYYWTKRES